MSGRSAGFGRSFQTRMAAANFVLDDGDPHEQQAADKTESKMDIVNSNVRKGKKEERQQGVGSVSAVKKKHNRRKENTKEPLGMASKLEHEKQRRQKRRRKRNAEKLLPSKSTLESTDDPLQATVPLQLTRERRGANLEVQVGAVPVAGIGAQGPASDRYSSQLSLRNSVSTSDPPILEAHLVSDDAAIESKEKDPLGGTGDAIEVPSAVVAGRLFCGINFQDRKVQICFILVVFAFIGLGVGLGIAIGGNNDSPSSEEELIDTAAPTAGPTRQISAAPTFLYWEDLGEVDAYRGADYYQDISFTGSQGNFGTAVALSQNGELLVVGFGSYPIIVSPGAQAFYSIARVFQYQNETWEVSTTIDCESWFTTDCPPIEMGYGTAAVAASSNGTRFALSMRMDVSEWSDRYESNHTAIVFDSYGYQLGQALPMGKGRSVSMTPDGEQIAVGQEDGTVGVYGFVNYSAWVQLGESIAQQTDHQPRAWALTKTTDLLLAVGSNLLPNPEEDYCPSGAASNALFPYSGFLVTVYATGSNTVSWTKVGQPIQGSEDESLLSEQSMALSEDGNVLAVGSSSLQASRRCVDYVSRVDKGRVRVYRRTDTEEVWVQIGSTLTGEGEGDLFGVSVSLSTDGDVLIVGSSGDRSGGFGSGKGTIYQFGGSDWTEVGDSIIGSSGDMLGRSVSVSGDGQTVAIGSPSSASKGEETGEVQVRGLAS